MGNIFSKPTRKANKRAREFDEIEDQMHQQKKPKMKSVFFYRHRSKKFMVKKRYMIHGSYMFSGDSCCFTIEKVYAELFFRYFGKFVLNLEINRDGEHDAELEKLIVKHCTSSMIEKITIDETTIGFDIPLNILFPNLTTLELFNVKLLEPKSIESNFPQLKSLVIQDKNSLIPSSTISELLRLNTQLETVRLKQGKNDQCFLRFVATTNKWVPDIAKLQDWQNLPDEVPFFCPNCLTELDYVVEQNEDDLIAEACASLERQNILLQ